MLVQNCHVFGRLLCSWYRLRPKEWNGSLFKLLFFQIGNLKHLLKWFPCYIILVFKLDKIHHQKRHKIIIVSLLFILLENKYICNITLLFKPYRVTGTCFACAKLGVLDIFISSCLREPRKKGFFFRINVLSLCAISDTFWPFLVFTRIGKNLKELFKSYYSSFILYRNTNDKDFNFVAAILCRVIYSRQYCYSCTKGFPRHKTNTFQPRIG